MAITSAVGLARRGHNVIFFAEVGPPAPALIDAGVHVICRGGRSFGHNPSRSGAFLKGLWNFDAAKAFDSALTEADPANSVVHIHNWAGALSASVLRRAIESGVRVVCTLHDYHAACPNGGFFDYRRSAPCGVRSLSASCWLKNCDNRTYGHKLWRNARQALQRHWAGFPVGVKDFIVLSNLSLKVLGPYLPGERRVHTLRNPIDVPPEAPIDVTANRPFTMVARLDRAKGVLPLLEASRRSNLPVLFIGDGECGDQIRSSEAPVQLTGWLEPREARRRLCEARALILPSLWYEAQPLVVLEAAARGIPAIVSDKCAGRELIEPGVTGLLFESGSVESLIGAMKTLQNNETVAAMGVAAYEKFWRDPPTMNAHINGLVTIYRRVISGESANPEIAAMVP